MKIIILFPSSSSFFLMFNFDVNEADKKDQISYPIISPDYLQLKKSLAGESPLNHYVIYI